MNTAFLNAAAFFDASKPVEAEMIDMSPSIALVIAIGVFVTAGIYLLLERSLTRVLLGVILVGNGINLMFMVAGGRAGGAPITGLTPENEMSDPLPQAMVLTAIVITLGLTAFVLAMAYRSWQLLGHDEVQDDLEDRRIARIAARNAPSVEGDDSHGDDDEFNPEDVAPEVRDETSDSSELDNLALAAQNAAHYAELATKEQDPERAAEYKTKAQWWLKKAESIDGADHTENRREDQDNELTESDEETAAQAALQENTSDLENNHDQEEEGTKND